MARSKPARKAARLPSGLYGWRGRAVPFARLPERERHRFRSLWSARAAETRVARRPRKHPVPLDRADLPKRLPRDPVKRAAKLQKVGGELERAERTGPIDDGWLLRRMVKQREHLVRYRKGEPERGRRAWQRRDPRLPDYLFYYHGD